MDRTVDGGVRFLVGAVDWPETLLDIATVDCGMAIGMANITSLRRAFLRAVPHGKTGKVRVKAPVTGRAGRVPVDADLRDSLSTHWAVGAVEYEAGSSPSFLIHKSNTNKFSKVVPPLSDFGKSEKSGELLPAKKPSKKILNRKFF